VEVGNALQTFPWELEAAVTERTAAVLYVAGAHLAGPVLPLAEVVTLAHDRGVPVIVDAAAQLPPVENLWRFTVEHGADLAVFSGGKDLEGPQASGLVVGSSELVEAIRVNAAPHQRLARAMKIGREEMVGLLVAVERYLTLDHEARIARWEEIVDRWVRALAAIHGVEASRMFPNEAGQPHPRALVRLDAGLLGLTGPGLRDALWESDPRIAVAVEGPDAISMSPDPLVKGEEELVITRIGELLARR
jgi:seryl-tRNA(Sec) selenium transferase